MSFRFLQPGSQFFEADGDVLALGSLTFTDSGTTNPRTTWSDPGMTTPNPTTVPLNGAGRPTVDIWGDGAYRVVLKDEAGATIVSLDDVSGPVGIPDPAGQAGKFLTNNGTVVSWAVISQVPNVTGVTAGWVLTADGGGNFAWTAITFPTVRQVSDPTGIAAGFVLTANGADGYGWVALPGLTARTWSDQTANRTLNVMYTNDATIDIEVNVSCQCRRASAGGGAFTATVAGVTVGIAAANGSTDNTSTLSFTVPAGAVYQVAQSATHNGYTWAELRP